MGPWTSIPLPVLDVLMATLGEAGGVAYLSRVAQDYPEAFVRLLGRVVEQKTREFESERALASAGIRRDREDE